VDSANVISGHEMAAISVDVLTNYSNKLDNVSACVDGLKKEVDDMKAMVHSAINSFQKMS